MKPLYLEFDHGQLNTMLPRKEYRILASKDKYWYIN